MGQTAHPKVPLICCPSSRQFGVARAYRQRQHGMLIDTACRSSDGTSVDTIVEDQAQWVPRCVTQLIAMIIKEVEIGHGPAKALELWF